MKLKVLVFIIFSLAFSFLWVGKSEAKCVQTGSECVEIPPDVEGKQANCPNDTPCEVYTWCEEGTDVCHYVCTNENSYDYTKPQPVPEGGGGESGGGASYFPTPYVPTPKATATPKPTATPRPPTSTPTPTPIPACDVSCTSDTYCDGASDGCTKCLPSTGGGKTCQPPPSATPTPSSTPTPTPTPYPFSEDMCKCDGLDATDLGIGVESTITAYGKVEGEETLYAKIPTMDFFLYKSTGGTTVEIIDQSNNVPTSLTVNEPTLNRYMATWKLNLPSDLDRTSTYRIQAKLNCSRKAPSILSATSKNVLAEQDNNSFFGNIINFFLQLFGTGRPTNSTTNPPNSFTPNSLNGDQIKLGTFYPAKVSQKDNCTFIKFNF